MINIKKHKNDVFRLAVNIEKETVSRILERIEADVTSFLSQIKKN